MKLSASRIDSRLEIAFREVIGDALELTVQDGHQEVAVTTRGFEEGGRWVWHPEVWLAGDLASLGPSRWA